MIGGTWMLLGDLVGLVMGLMGLAMAYDEEVSGILMGLWKSSDHFSSFQAKALSTDPRRTNL